MITLVSGCGVIFKQINQLRLEWYDETSKRWEFGLRSFARSDYEQCCQICAYIVSIIKTNPTLSSSGNLT